jgi:hypothetical protein
MIQLLSIIQLKNSLVVQEVVEYVAMKQVWRNSSTLRISETYDFISFDYFIGLEFRIKKSVLSFVVFMSLLISGI